jgi:hypothetical protein
MEKLVFDAFLGISCLVAWLKGGQPERVAAVLFVFATLLSLAVVSSGGEMFGAIEWGLFFVDLCLFITLVALSLASDRYWPMWLASLQMVSVWMHPAFGMTESKMAYAYAVASIFWSYPMLIILVIGALRHDRRVRAMANLAHPG